MLVQIRINVGLYYIVTKNGDRSDLGSWFARHLKFGSIGGRFIWDRFGTIPSNVVRCTHVAKYNTYQS